MDHRLNPYNPGAGTQPPELAGRDELIEEASIAIDRTLAGRHSRSMMLLGLRGVGKTVLLNRFDNMAIEAGCITFLLEAPENESLPSLLVPRLRAVLQRLDFSVAAVEFAKRARRLLAGFTKAFKLSYEGFDVSVEIDPGAASGLLELDLPELFIAIGTAAREAEKTVVFFIDEVQYLSQKDLAALIVGIHRINQKGLPILFFGSGLPQIAALAGEAKSYAERLFQYVRIGPLDAVAADEALIAPVKHLGVEYTSEALALIRASTKGYPYFLQEWGKHCWDLAARSPIDAEVVEQATLASLSSLDEGFFNVRYDRLTPREQDYVLAMARLGPGTHSAGDISKALKTSVQKAGSAKNSLTKKGMVYSPSYGQTAFTVPLFDEFLLRREARSS